MVRAYHVVFGAYGFWLPNDPRGSWSKFVASWELFLAAGPATTTDTRRSVAAAPHDRVLRRRGKLALQFPEVKLDGLQARTIASSFGRTADTLSISIFALSILPQHIHLVLSRNTHKVEAVIREFKQEATEELVAAGQHPFIDCHDSKGRIPCLWAKKCWKVYLSKIEDMERSIRYVESNPEKEGKPRQRRKLVKPVSPDDV